VTPLPPAIRCHGDRVVDLSTLDVVCGYRGEGESTEPLPFGVSGEVLEPGSVAPGDLVERPA